MTRIVAVRLKLTEPGIPGTPLMIVVNVLETVTVTVTTRCVVLEQAVELSQVLGGEVAENGIVPASVAHSHKRVATAVTPVRFGDAPVALVCIVAVSPLCAALWAPYCAPARAALVKAMDA